MSGSGSGSVCESPVGGWVGGWGGGGVGFEICRFVGLIFRQISYIFADLKFISCCLQIFSESHVL